MVAVLGFSDLDVQFSFELGLLHDCGVSMEQMHSSLVNHFDWSDMHIHCEIGSQLLSGFAPLSKYSIPILYHHTKWNNLVKLDLSAYEIRMANLIFLADRIDVSALSHYGSDILLAKKQIVEAISAHKGSYFDSEIIDAFLRVEQSEAFWIALEDRHITRYTWDMGQFTNNEQLSLAQLKQLSLIMSYIVDQKSPFTAQHSVRVASVAKFIALFRGLSSEQCEKVEIAGLLHDLGKLHTPDNILEKPGPLNKVERAIMNQHSYETFEILRHIKGLDEIARWAAFHHEGINGAGYPFHPREQDLSVEARIIAVADIFQALVQDRPYRTGMGLSAVIKIINEMSDSGKLDKKIVALVNQKSEECFEIARGDNLNNNQAYIDMFPEG